MEGNVHGQIEGMEFWRVHLLKIQLYALGSTVSIYQHVPSYGTHIELSKSPAHC